MSSLDSSVFSFLFTDVEGSTRLWERSPDAMREALEAHDRILRAAIADADGSVFSNAGDAFAAAFSSPTDAIAAASAAQRDLGRHPWPDGASIKVRMGVHTGPAQQRDGDYFGPTLNRGARLMSAAHGGQLVVSDVTRLLAVDVALADMGEHRLKDLSAPEHVWQVLVAGQTGEFPPLRTLDAVPTNLPVALASFVGREDEIEALMTALAEHRLVTITGVGGVGKTRLSLQVAADASHHYPDGLWFVELAPVRIGHAVPFGFLETMGVEAEPGRSPMETVAATIGTGAVLLVIDNCEHVIDPAAAAVSELLGACPNLRILASSRRPLGLSGEQVRPISPLSVGGTGSAATRLFIDRAEAAGFSGRLDGRLHVVESICRQLDGLPLAIELAAARTRSMTPEDVADRLGERFRLLKASPRSSDERHRTLLSTIEWSHDLLDDDQKLLFERLSVFAGSITLDAVEQVCADEHLDQLDVIDLLDDLVDQSLVIPDMKGEHVRFRMLETIREFAAVRLGDELQALRDRHSAYHAEFAQRIGVGMRTTDELEVLDELEAGWSDLRAAAVHATSDLALLARLLEPLAMDALWRSRVELGDWAEAALAVADLDGSTDEDRAVFLGCASIARGADGDAVTSIELAVRLAELCEQTDTALPLGIGPPVVAAMVIVGDVGLGVRLQEQFELAAQDRPERWAPSLVAGSRALVASFSGETDLAREAAETAVEKMPDDLCLSMRAFIGWMHVLNSDAAPRERVEQMEQVVEQARFVRSTLIQSALIQFLSGMRAALGDLARPMVELADELDRARGHRDHGLVTGAVLTGIAMLIKSGYNDPAVRLSSWVENQDGSNAVTPAYATTLQKLVSQVHRAMGADLAGAQRAGAAMSVDEALELASSTLRRAARDPSD